MTKQSEQETDTLDSSFDDSGGAGISPVQFAASLHIGHDGVANCPSELQTMVYILP